MAVVLVTGASGFVGSHLVEALAERGDEVRCLVRRSSARGFLERLGVTLVEGDVTQPASLAAAVSGVDVVYNVAGMVSALRAVDQIRVNRDGVDNVARACAAQRDPPVHVLVSSIAAAGPAPRDGVRVEADRATPVSDYGRSKRQGELAAERWAARVPTTIVRPGIVYGARDRQLVLMFRSIARYHLHAVPCRLPPRLSFIYAPDLAQLLMEAADSGERLPSADELRARVSHASRVQRELVHPSGDGMDRDGETLAEWSSAAESQATRQSAHGEGYYFACGVEHPDLLEFGRMLADATETSRVLCLRMAPPLARIVAGVSQLGGRMTGRPAALNLDKIREAVAPSWACSGEKARRGLGFLPLRSLTQRLRETADWYRRQGWL